MNELALFAGIGGGILGGKLCGFRTICAVEINGYCRGVLLHRQKEGLLPLFPIWDDVQTFDGRPWSNVVDIITGGFPCQPFSLAGKRQQENDERNMWPDTIRIIREVRPPFVLLENVPGLLSSGFFSTILAGLSEAGYMCQWEIISAAEVGAPHIRKRLWITGVLSDTKSVRLQTRFMSVRTSEAYSGFTNGNIKKGILENTRCEHGEPWSKEQGMLRRMSEDWKTCNQSQRPKKTFNGWWSVEPGVGRVANGITHRNDRLKAIGNAQVPRVAAEAWRRFIS